MRPNLAPWLTAFALAAVVDASTVRDEMVPISRSMAMPSAMGPDAGLPSTPAAASAPAALLHAPTLFVQSVGQSELPGAFIASFAHGRAAFDRDGFFLQFIEEAAPVSRSQAEARSRPTAPVSGVNLRFTFEQARPEARIEGEQRLPTHVNVYEGAPGGWHEDIPAYAAVRCTNVYPGVSVLYHDVQSTLEYDLLLQPGADPSQLVLRCEGADAITIEPEGTLALSTALGTWRFPRPVTWSDVDGKRRPLACRYRSIDRERFGFEVDGWDRRDPLVIDPGLAYASYLGGISSEVAFAVVGDAAGYAYVGGRGGGTGFPITPGVFLSTGGSGAAFLTKFTPDGSGLVYSTYLAKGSAVNALAVTSGGEAVAACEAGSKFPTTPGAFDTTYNSAGDTFEMGVAKLDAAAGHLVFSTYLGGSANDFVGGVALGPDETVYVAGTTSSSDYPTTPGSYWPAGTGDNAFVTRLAADGGSLVWSTLLGSPVYSDSANALVVDGNGSAVVVGRTDSNEPNGFPATPGAFDPTPNGALDSFVVRLDPSGSRLVFATFLGGADIDQVSDVCLAADGSIYVTGKTASFNFPTTPGALQPWTWGGYDVFVSHLSSDGATLLHSTLLGYSLNDEAYAVGVTPQGRVVIADYVDNPLYITPDAARPLPGGAIHVLDAALSKVLYGSCLGAAVPFDMAVDPTGFAYIVGQTDSPNLATPGAFDTTLGSTIDAFVEKFDFSPWVDLGKGLAGTGQQIPHLAGAGSLQPGSSGSLTLSQARPLAALTLVIGVLPINASFKGGTLVPAPMILLPLATDASGSVFLPWNAWPSGLPPGTNVFLQAWVSDPVAPKGLSASNGLQAVTPVPFAGG